jgi:hypothetical protein
MQVVKPGRTVNIESPHLLLQCEAKKVAEVIAGFVDELGG